uniref:Uncharacterized protein MANES_03G087500 n=1 Tax=Rhizophora mucronata TaxID=61149 RepID=A0A2P2KGI9_RHIMU
MRSGSEDLGLGTLPFFLPYPLMELALKTSSLFVLLMGMVSSGHLPFKCHNWPNGFVLSLLCEDNLLSANSPSGR